MNFVLLITLMNEGSPILFENYFSLLLEGIVTSPSSELRDITPQRECGARLQLTKNDREAGKTVDSIATISSEHAT